MRYVDSKICSKKIEGHEFLVGSMIVVAELCLKVY